MGRYEVCGTCGESDNDNACCMKCDAVICGECVLAGKFKVDASLPHGDETNYVCLDCAARRAMTMDQRREAYCMSRAHGAAFALFLLKKHRLDAAEEHKAFIASEASRAAKAERPDLDGLDLEDP